MNKKSIFLNNAILTSLFSPIRFLLNLYLASKLSPIEYGQIVIPILILSISDLFIDSGLRTSLIQKSSLNNKHSSSIFFYHLFISSIIFIIIILFSSNLVSFDFSKEMRFLVFLSGLILFIKSISLISEARMQIKFQFGTLVFYEFISNLFAYVITILYSVYFDKKFSLIILYFLIYFFFTLLVFSKEKFIPKLNDFSIKLIYFHWRSGKKILTQGILELVNDKLDELVALKIVNTSSLGIYSKGRELSNTIGIFGSKFFSRPWFSVMSKFSSDKLYFKTKYNYAVNFLFFFIVIFLNISYYFGDFIIQSFLGNNWLGLIEYFKYFILYSAFYFLIVFNKYTLAALGLFNKNLYFENLYIFFKLIFIIIFIYFFFNQNISTKNILLAIIVLDLFSKLIIYFIQSKSLGIYLNSNPKKYLLNFFLIIFFLLSFLISNTLLFILSSLFMILFLVFNLFVLPNFPSRHAIN